MPTTLGPPDYFAAINYTQSNFYSSSVRDDGQTVVMHALVAYSDMLSFEQTMKGFCYFDGRIRRYPPQLHYQRFGLYAKQVDFVREVSEPTADALGNLVYTDLLADGKTLGVNGHGKIEMAVTFEAPEGGMVPKPDSQRPAGRTDELWRAVSRRIENEVTSQQLPKHALAFAAGSSQANKPVPAVGAVVLATATLYYTVDWPIATPGFPQAVGNVESNISNGTGSINSVTFDGQYPPYTLLALAPKRQLIMQADGSFAVRMTYVFAQRGTVDVSASDADSAYPDWTRILNGSTDSATAYSRVNRVGAPTKFAYRTADFKLFFTP